MTEIVIKTKIGRQISKITTTQLICDKAPSDLGFCVIIENDNGCVIIMNFLLCIWKGDGFFLFVRPSHAWTQWPHQRAGNFNWFSKSYFKNRREIINQTCCPFIGQHLVEAIIVSHRCCFCCRLFAWAFGLNSPFVIHTLSAFINSD